MHLQVDTDRKIFPFPMQSGNVLRIEEDKSVKFNSNIYLYLAGGGILQNIGRIF